MRNDELSEEFLQEAAGIFALYGRAFANGLDSSPNYSSEDIENFLGYDVSYILDELVNEGILESESKERLNCKVYEMSDENAKADAFLTWKVLKDEFNGYFEDMRENMGEVKEILKNQNVQYAQ